MKLAKATPTFWTELTDTQSELINGGFRGIDSYRNINVKVAVATAVAISFGGSATAGAGAFNL